MLKVSRFSLTQAQALVLENVRTMPGVWLPLAQAVGWPVARDVTAGAGLPRWNLAAKDGYALAASRTLGADSYFPAVFRLASRLFAGATPGKRLREGEAARIMTGAVMPSGADTVVPLEDVQESKEYVKIFRAVPPGSNVKAKGEEVQRGDLIVKKGIPLEPREIEVLASLGKDRVRVCQRPKVAILCTGDELTMPGEKTSRGKVVASNSYLLLSIILDLGSKIFSSKVVSDKEEQIRAAFLKGKGADLIISSGGASRGDKDFTGSVLEKLGAKIMYKDVAMSPGRHQIFALLERVPVFALPGGPMALFMAFEQLVRPALLKMSGFSSPFRPPVKGVLTEAVSGREGERNFKTARAFWQAERLFVRPIKRWHQAGPRNDGEMPALIVLEEDKEQARAGELVTVQLLA